MSEHDEHAARNESAGRGGRGNGTQRGDEVERSAEIEREILTIDEAAELLGVSVKTFNKVLHSQNMPARKIGREWKFSRRALIDWVGAGRSKDFYNAQEGDDDESPKAIKPERTRRTAGWNIEY